MVWALIIQVLAPSGSPSCLAVFSLGACGDSQLTDVGAPERQDLAALAEAFVALRLRLPLREAVTPARSPSAWNRGSKLGPQYYE